MNIYIFISNKNYQNNNKLAVEVPVSLTPSPPSLPTAAIHPFTHLNINTSNGVTLPHQQAGENYGNVLDGDLLDDDGDALEGYGDGLDGDLLDDDGDALEGYGDGLDGDLLD
eukprot:474543_1